MLGQCCSKFYLRFIQGCARFAEIFAWTCINWELGLHRKWGLNRQFQYFKALKTTEYKLHKIWRSQKFCKISEKRAHSRVSAEVVRRMRVTLMVCLLVTVVCFASVGASDDPLFRVMSGLLAKRRVSFRVHLHLHDSKTDTQPGVCSFCWNCMARQKTERVGATESKVWIGNFNVK